MEFKGIELGDKHLNRQAILLAEQLSGNPTPNIPQACGGWAETAAASRFFAQDRKEWTDVMEPYWHCSAGRTRACDAVLCLDDTIELNFNGQEIVGLGPLSYGAHVHATYAVTPQREPLGVLNACMWALERKGRRWPELQRERKHTLDHLPAQRSRIYAVPPEINRPTARAVARKRQFPRQTDLCNNAEQVAHPLNEGVWETGEGARSNN